MKEQRVSQQEICRYLNLTKHAFSDWKSGKSESYLKYLPQIAEYLDVSVDYLLGKSYTEQEEVTQQEKELLAMLKQLNEEDLETALRIVQRLAEKK